ncbi:uncharacterized protein LOC125027261 [Penaeus chinensis]|uniref:uncharacterized protein LOC125027261 n=1 Tax=Penaeus chinensis TaxID=139456 RepID=UPI001FB6D6FD|nr:uncharacterized protein LOC125027261 [Penaeus chinensis]
MSQVSVQMSSTAHQSEASEDLLSDISAEKRVNVLHRPLRPLHFVLGLAGLWPYWYDKAASEYKLLWLSAQGAHTMLTFGYISVLLLTTAFGVFRMVLLQQTDAADPPADPKKQSIKITGVVMVVGYLINAWVQLLNTILAGRRLCRLLNRWNKFHVATFIDPTKGLYVKSCVKVVYMVAFMITMLVLTVVEVPEFLLDVLDGLAEHIFLVPSAWLIHSGVFTKVVRTAVCSASLHQFIVNKGTVFAFTTSCHLLRKGFATWNNHLQEALEGDC